MIQLKEGSRQILMVSVVLAVIACVFGSRVSGEAPSQAKPAWTGRLPESGASQKPTGTGAAAKPAAPAAESPPDVGQAMPLFDGLMNEAIKSREIPGGALAIAKDGKLLVARGYGMANVGSHEPATLDTLFCTATVTKTITAVAVLRLVDQGKLSLDSAVYPFLGKPRPLGRSAIDPQIEKITVRQLLLHAGGWDTKHHPDFLRQTQKIARVAGEKLPLPNDAVLRFGLSQPLDFAPGTESHYSNFGYYVAKLVVEHLARQPYETYVRQQVLRPMGIQQMRMEQLAPGYAAHEAHRYGTGGRELSGGREPIAAPAGNWLGSVVDLARFLTAVSGSRGKPFLTSAARQEMLAAAAFPLGGRRSGSHVGLGWDSVSEEPSGIQFHKNGSAAGVHVYVEHRADGIDWVLMLNADGRPDGKPVAELVDQLRRAMDATRVWPDRDLFEGPAPAQRQKSKGAVVL